MAKPKHHLANIFPEAEIPQDVLDILISFAMYTKYPGVPEDLYNSLNRLHPRTRLPRWKRTKRIVAEMTEINPVWYDCCPKSCCCFVGQHALKTTCPYCGHDRLNSAGKPYRRFMYIPLIPRLRELLGHCIIARHMLYRAQHRHNPDKMTDYQDGSHYRRLRATPVSINGRLLPHHHFSDDRDIALGFSTDGFLLFEKSSKSAWPLIIFNYNLPPELRFLKENVIILGAIPGKPKDFDSFFWPLFEELLLLEQGVLAWDVLSDSSFILHAYLFLVLGDIPAISLVMRMKGVNGYCPCRWCEIRGVRIPGATHCPYYVPLDRSNFPATASGSNLPQSYDPYALPMRSHTSFLKQAQEVQNAQTASEQKKLSMKYGINGIPLIAQLSSISVPESFPFDFMHEIWENLIKNLIALWTGDFKGLDEGSGNYHLTRVDWQAIGEESKSSGATIPSAFGARLPNVAEDRQSWTAETRSLWSLYVAPYSLSGRLRQQYFQHFIDLVKVLAKYIDYEYSRVDREEMKLTLIKWVKGYERYGAIYHSRRSMLTECIFSDSTINTPLPDFQLAHSQYTGFCISRMV
jgi:hypothetical protein